MEFSSPGQVGLCSPILSEVAGLRFFGDSPLRGRMHTLDSEAGGGPRRLF